MTNEVHRSDTTGLLVIDPYNDFISPGGKVWDRLKDVIEANHCVPHMKQVLDAARGAQIRVFYALHRRYRPGDYESLEVNRARAESGVATPHVRIRQLGRRTPPGFHTAAR